MKNETWNYDGEKDIGDVAVECDASAAEIDNVV
jgi:hypothetical protein